MCITEYNEKHLLDSERRYSFETGMAKGKAAGIAEGKAEGKSEERLHSLRNIMDSLSCTADHAMRLLKIPEDEWDNLLKLLNQNIIH